MSDEKSPFFRMGLTGAQLLQFILIFRGIFSREKRETPVASGPSGQLSRSLAKGKKHSIFTILFFISGKRFLFLQFFDIGNQLIENRLLVAFEPKLFLDKSINTPPAILYALDFKSKCIFHGQEAIHLDSLGRINDVCFV
jgi:hypothetical protein